MAKETAIPVWAKALTASGKAWIERDREARLGLLREALTEDARYTASGSDVSGVDGICDMIDDIHGRMVDYRIWLTSEVDGHHDCIRFTWALETTQDGDKVVVDGADTIMLSEDGKLQRILVFDGAQPPPPATA